MDAFLSLLKLFSLSKFPFYSGKDSSYWVLVSWRFHWGTLISGWFCFWKGQDLVWLHSSALWCSHNGALSCPCWFGCICVVWVESYSTGDSRMWNSALPSSTCHRFHLLSIFIWWVCIWEGGTVALFSFLLFGSLLTANYADSTSLAYQSYRQGSSLLVHAIIKHEKVCLIDHSAYLDIIHCYVSRCLEDHLYQWLLSCLPCLPSVTSCAVQRPVDFQTSGWLNVLLLA